MNFFKTKFVLVIVFVLNACLLKAQDRNTQIANAHKLLKERGEVCFTFEVLKFKDISNYSSKLSIDNVNGKTVKAYANKSEFDKFLKENISFSIVEPILLPEEGLSYTDFTLHF